MKPSELKAQICELAETPGMHLNAEERLRYLTPEQITACDAATGQIEELNALQRENIARVAVKLKRLQKHLIDNKRGEEYARFRFCADKSPMGGDEYPAANYQQEGFPVGGVYQQTEDEREAFIDAKLKLEGLD